MESLYAGLNWAHVILSVPIDQVIPANQRAQGNKGRNGVSLSLSVSELLTSRRRPVVCSVIYSDEFITLLESHTRIFETVGFLRVFYGFFLKTKGFLPKLREIFVE